MPHWSSFFLGGDRTLPSGTRDNPNPHCFRDHRVSFYPSVGMQKTDLRPVYWDAIASAKLIFALCPTIKCVCFTGSALICRGLLPCSIPL